MASARRINKDRVEELDRDGNVIGVVFGKNSRPPQTETIQVPRYRSGTIAVIQLGKRTVVVGG